MRLKRTVHLSCLVKLPQEYRYIFFWYHTSSGEFADPGSEKLFDVAKDGKKIALSGLVKPLGKEAATEFGKQLEPIMEMLLEWGHYYSIAYGESDYAYECRPKNERLMEIAS